MSEIFENPVEEGSLQHQVEELREQASKDALSGLLNRVSAEEYIKIRLKNMGPEENCALFIVDLDDFKRVNDTLGHQTGDQAIRQTAQILSGLFRAKDIVGRLGGDEFMIFLAGAITEKLVQKKAAAICENVQMVLGNEPAVVLTASVGVYISAGNHARFEGLYQSADLALYRAKKGGKHCFCIKRSEGVPEGEDDFRPVNTIPLTGLLEYMDSGVALLEMDDPMNLLYVSPSFCRILGVDPKVYTMPKSLGELVHPEDRMELEQTLWKGLNQRQWVEHTHRVSLDGVHWSWWHIRAVQIDYDNPYPVMLVTTTDISHYKENERRLEEINQRLQIAFDQTTQILWEVDLQRREFRLFQQGSASGGAAWVAFPDALIESGWLHPNSVSRFREFAEELLAGQVQGYGSFIVQSKKTGCYGWAALSYRMVLGEGERAAKAVGILENIPQNFVGNQTQSILKRPLPETLLPDLVVGLRANLTQDTVQELWVEGRDFSTQAREERCTQVLKRALGKLFCPGDRERCTGYFDREALLEQFAQGQHWLWAEYQRVDAGGTLHWVGHTANLAEDPLTHEVYLFLYIRRMDRRRAWEQMAGLEVRRDPVTKLYERKSARAMAEAVLSQHRPGSCAVAMIQLRGLVQRYAHDPEVLNQKRFYGAMALMIVLGSDWILGQYSADQIVGFLPNARSKPELRSQLEEAFSFARLVLAGSMDLEGLRFVAGVVLEPVNGANYDSMAAQTSGLSQLWRDAAADMVVFPHQEENWTWNEIQTRRRGDQVTVHQTEMERPLSEQEKDVAFRCVSAMLAADSLESSIHSVLNYIGSYYHADRVYILTLLESQNTVAMPYEWTEPQKQSIRQAVSGMSVDHFPMLKRCMEEQAPIFLTRTCPISLQGEKATEEPWYFTVFPLIDRRVFRGFLCVENSREHPADAALFSTLIPYILREEKRFQNQRGLERESSTVNLLGLPNLRSYMEMVSALNSDRYHSIGAVCVDIPNLSVLNSQLGFGYGSRLLWYVSKTLADIFGANWIFRTWDAEFVALCPDTTHQAFSGSCSRLRAMLQCRYPKELRIGHIWSDGVFRAKDLVNEARRRMRSEAIAGTEQGEAFVLDSGRYHNVAGAVRGGRFVVHFQPKMDLKTGGLLGAEALVRGISEDGGVVLPDVWLGGLERTGDIRELDLFVLERTLAQMEQWREQGLGVVPVSVNLSRVTLFSPTALASILAIQSRYPQIPSEALELELTESGGNVAAASLREVTDQFRQCGLRVGLDDFGSKYANLSIFTNVRFDTVKLDRSLIADLTDNPISRMLVQDIIQICRTCGMNCVAEGVENQEQAAALDKMGCSCAQGYLYAPPLPPEEFEQKYLRSGESTKPNT